MNTKYISFLTIIFVFTLSTYSVGSAVAPAYTFNTPSQCSTPTKELFITGGPGLHYNESTLTAPVNTCVQIKFHNADSIYHSFSIEGVSSNNVTYFNIYLNAQLTNASNFWTGNTNSTYKYFCQVPGHDAGGMNGKLIVGTGGGSSSSKSSPGFSFMTAFAGLFVVYGVAIIYKKKRRN